MAPPEPGRLAGTVDLPSVDGTGEMTGGDDDRVRRRRRSPGESGRRRRPRSPASSRRTRTAPRRNRPVPRRTGEPAPVFPPRVGIRRRRRLRDDQGWPGRRSGERCRRGSGGWRRPRRSPPRAGPRAPSLRRHLRRRIAAEDPRPHLVELLRPQRGDVDRRASVRRRPRAPFVLSTATPCAADAREDVNRTQTITDRRTSSRRKAAGP